MNTEPAYDIRLAANTLRQTYVALINEGFDADQALTITIAMMQSGMAQGE